MKSIYFGVEVYNGMLKKTIRIFFTMLPNNFLKNYSTVQEQLYCVRTTQFSITFITLYRGQRDYCNLYSLFVSGG